MIGRIAVSVQAPPMMVFWLVPLVLIIVLYHGPVLSAVIQLKYNDYSNFKGSVFLFA